MDDPRVARLFAQARQGKLSRRQILNTGLRLGLASPVIMALIEAAPRTTSTAAARSAVLPAAQGEGSGTFTVLIASGTEDIDPHSSYTTLSSTVALAAYEMLLQLKGDSTDEFEPMLAESWEVSPDNSTYTFKLAPNAKFQDGTACDAQAVKDSFTRFLLMGQGPVNVISRFVSDPNQIEVVDPATVRFNLGTPQPLFLSAMSSQYGPSVVSPTAVQEHKTDDDEWAHEWLKANAVGTGPYQLVENTLNERMILKRFEDFHRGWEGNHFDQIVFRVAPEDSTRRQLLEQGEADASAYNLTVDDIEALKTNPAVQVVEYPSTAANWVIMNVPRLKTVDVRKGFCYAFPYQQVRDGVYKDLIKPSGPIPDNVRGYDPNVFLYQTDLDKAKELILSGGFKEGDTFEYMSDSTDERDQAMAQLFQANLQQIGFNLEVTSVDYGTLESTVLGNAPAEERPHFLPWGWWPDYNDPWNQLAPNFLKSAIGEGGSNAGYWVNDQFEKIMAEAEHYTDENRLNELMKQAQNILTEQDPPAIFYGQVIRYTVVGKDIQGFVPNPLYLDAFNFYTMSRAG